MFQSVPRNIQFALLSVLLFAPAFVSAQDFTARALGDYGNVTVMEIQGNYDARLADGTENLVPRQEIAKEFFKTHKDEYDFLVIFTNFGYHMPETEALSFFKGIKNDSLGIGLPLYDGSEEYGSSRLQGTIDMGNIANHATAPLDPRFEGTLRVLSHELMHRWASYIKFKDASGNFSTALLGKDGFHWSFLLDTAGSLMYGNTWQDNGNGTFTSLSPMAEMKYYSPLDLYLMGMIDKSKVPPMLLITSPTTDSTQLPQTGVTVNGTARYVTMDQISASSSTIGDKREHGTYGHME